MTSDTVEQIAGRVAVRAAAEDFRREVEGRQFRHPHTGNMVKFESLPRDVQERVHRQWMSDRAERDRRVEEMARGREDESGMGHSDERSRYSELGRGIFAMSDWTFLPEGAGWRSGSEDATAAHMVTMPAFVHGGPGRGRPGDEEQEPPPPAEVRRMLAERMRDMGRGLMVAGAKPPRQQMVEVGRVIDGLLDQLEMLADQPGRVALRRRILLGLRGRALGH